jgi:hypothetical protein
MLKMGVPAPAVGLKMKAEGLDPALLEYAFPLPPPLHTPAAAVFNVVAAFLLSVAQHFCSTPDAPAPPGEEEEDE